MIAASTASEKRYRLAYSEVILADARIKATAACEQVAKGINPSDLRKQDKVEKNQEQEKQQFIANGLSVEGSFQFVGEEWMIHRLRDIIQP